MARPRAFDEDTVLDAAIGCFWRRGYEATSVRELADEMGVGGASLYNAFGDKRSLFTRALDRYCEQTTRARLVRLQTTLPPRAAIETFFAEILARSLDDPERKGCLLINSALEVAPHDREMAGAIAGYLEEIRTFLARAIAAGQREGAIAAHLDPDTTASHLLGVLVGMRVLARARPEPQLLASVVAPALALLQPTTEPSAAQ